jgi:hypothetical protein
LRREGCSRCLARHFLYRRLRHSCADSNVPWADASPSPNNSSILRRGVSPAHLIVHFVFLSKLIGAKLDNLNRTEHNIHIRKIRSLFCFLFFVIYFLNVFKYYFTAFPFSVSS